MDDAPYVVLVGMDFSELADRARYYRDMVGIFEELKIPWQQWFMIMSADGTVIPEYRQALLLDE